MKLQEAIALRAQLEHILYTYEHLLAYLERHLPSDLDTPGNPVPPSGIKDGLYAVPEDTLDTVIGEVQVLHEQAVKRLEELNNLSVAMPKKKGKKNDKEEE